MEGDLGRAAQLAQQGILNFIEGGNEEDDPYATSNGNSLAIAARYQQTVWQVAHQYGLPAINMSFGQGWTVANDWHGDYDKVGNLAPYADYANAHTYPSGAPDSTIQALNSDAQIAAVGRPVITTEIGWDTNSTDPVTAAKYTLDAALDGMKDGDAKTYFYALFDDGSGAYGLMNADGSAKPAGAALHNLTTLLSDPGAGSSFTPASLTYGLAGTASGDNTLLLEKSDGSYWLAIWDETAAPHTVTLNLGSAAAVQVFDPLTGITAVQTASNVSTLQIAIPDHPVLVEIVPGTGSDGGGSGGGNPPTPQDLAVTVPAAKSVVAGATLTVSGTAINDVWAATAGGSMALNVYDLAGTITIAGQKFGPGGGKVAGGMLVGTEAQLNADLATLTYTASASAGTDSLTIDVWNQVGVEATETVAITVTAPADSGPVITVPPTPAVTVGTSALLAGISFTDPIGNEPGSMVLDVTAAGGTITMKDANGNAIAGSGTGAISLSGTRAQLDADLTRLAFIGAAAGSGSVIVDVRDQLGKETTRTLAVTISSAQPTGPAIATPAAESVTAGATRAISGVSVADLYAAVTPGTLALNLTASGGGTLDMIGADGLPVAGSGTGAISVAGTLAQINADLARLSLTAGGPGTGSIFVNVWDQAGMESTVAIPVAITARPLVTIAATSQTATINLSNVTISATAGNHMIFIGGSNDILNATGGREQVTALQGGNSITTGASADIIRLGGSGNVVNAGGGSNTITDTGSGNIIVLSLPGQGHDTILSSLAGTADTLDLRPLLADTAWNGAGATLGNFLITRMVGSAQTILSVRPSGVSGSATYAVAQLSDAFTLSGMLAHSVT